jgi:hypothetical protein
MDQFTDSAISNFVASRHWDTVLLVSEANGRYYFKTNDRILKKCEGYWFVESDNLEGDCVGYIKQNNLRKPVPVAPFRIAVLDSLRFSMQFFQIDSVDSVNSDDK